MKKKLYRSAFNKLMASGMTAVLIIPMFAFSGRLVFAQQDATSAPAQETPAEPKIPNDQLDSLVAPIALYPDPLLSQVLVAATYPLELIQMQQWVNMRGQYLNDQAKVEAVSKEGWDPSIQAMVLLPEVASRLAANIKWTADLGNAFLAQQSDVMDAVQRMRTKAKDAGKLQSSDKMKVETQQAESKSIVVIEQADPEVIYVPSYDPGLIWGTVGYYPFPPIYYPPYAGLYAFGVGIAIGAAWGGGWGWGAGWGNNDININRNNNFNRNSNINRGNRVNPLNSGSNRWQHNPQHRGGAPYANRSIANRYGGAARGDSMASRGAAARQNPANFGGNRASAGTMDRSGLGGGGNRGNFGGGGGDRIGSRDVSRGSSNRGSFGGSRDFGGGSTRNMSSRGSSSMGSRGGFGGSRGGGGFGGGRGGGGMRGGGGRR